MAMKITGLDQLTRKMKELSSAAGELDGDIASVRFDPHDPASIEQAIQTLSDAIDEKLSGYEANDWVVGIGDQLKEQGRQAILERASAARASGEDDE